MWLVLCPSTDVAALWAYEGLKSRGLTPLELVCAEELACSLQWNHRVSSSGTRTNIALADGRTITHDAVRGVLNRLAYLPQEHLALGDSSDRDYAQQELTAFYLSWLYAMPRPMLNVPTAQGLCGAWRHISEWVWLAGKAGLPTIPYRQSSFDRSNEEQARGNLTSAQVLKNTVFVVNEQVVGASPPEHIMEGCRRLAELSGTGLLAIEFMADETSSWTFAGATSLPDLRLGGDPLLDLMASVFQKGGRS
jgi:hypothetical protein